MRTVRRSSLALIIGLLGFSLFATPGASAFQIGSFSGSYIAGSVEVEPAMDEAVGPNDCHGLIPTGDAGAGTVGGACFDLSDFPNADWFMTLTDDVSTDVSVFAGFDLDGDGCVGCVPGADLAFEGHNTLGGFVPQNGTMLAVFVRAVSIGEDGAAAIGTTGTIEGEIHAPGSGPCKHEPRDPACGSVFDGELPYPYPCLDVPPSC